MIPKGLFAQIGMIIVSIAIVVTYVQPTFENMAKVQDDIAVYKAERDKVVKVNSDLASLVTQLEQVSTADLLRLDTYMPSALDPIAIPRDLALITAEAGVIYNSASFEGKVDAGRDADDSRTVSEPAAYLFNLSVEGTYSQLKNLFRLLEQNNYPLEVSNLTIERSEGSFLTANISLVTYEHQQTDLSNQIVF